MHTTSFVLAPEIGNRHKIDHVLKETIEMPYSIPFLRDVRNVDNPSYKKKQMSTMEAPTVGAAVPHHKMNRKNSKELEKLEKKKIREHGWN